MRKIFLLLLIPIVLSCVRIIPESISLISKTREDLIYFTQYSVYIVSGDHIDLSFSIDSSNCREERVENLVILLGNKKLWEERITVFPGTLETKKLTIRVPIEFEGMYTFKIIVGQHSRYFNVTIYRQPGDFMIIDHEILEEGEKVKEKVKIANFRGGIREFSVFVNGKRIGEIVVTSRISQKEIEFTPVLGINEIKICDEDENCQNFYEYITEIREEKKENLTKKVEKGMTYINPYIIIGIIVFLAFLVAKVVL